MSKAIRELCAASDIDDSTSAAKIRSIFQEWDTDGNGLISEEELTNVIKRLCPHFSDEVIKALFKAADVDSSGAIDYNEFLDFLCPSAKKELTQGEIDALRAVFDRFDEDGNELLSRAELANLMQNMLPTRAHDFDLADTDGSGAVDFNEFVDYWKSIVGSPGFEADQFDEASDMFDKFDTDKSGDLDKDEFLSLLDNLFPARCDQNAKHVAAEFAACDSDSSNNVSFDEFIAYYGRLRMLYGQDGLGWPPGDAEERKATLEPDFVTSRCGLKFLPDRCPVHERGCKRCRELEEEERKRRAEEEARRNAEEDARRRAEEEAEAKRLAEEEERRRKEEEARRFAEEEAAWIKEMEEEARRRAEADAMKPQPNEHGFVPCPYCGRTFFPDRLPPHLRVCKKKKNLMPSGCRETVTPGETKASVGRYDAGWLGGDITQLPGSIM